MKTILRLFISLFAVSSLVGLAVAQPSPKIAVVDLGRLYDGHYKVAALNVRLRSDYEKAKVELDRLNNEYNKLAEQFNQKREQLKTAVDEAAKAAVVQDLTAKRDAILRKEDERTKLNAAVEQHQRDEDKKIRDPLLDEIGRIASRVAKTKGATLVIDKSGPSILGHTTVLYTDASYDITDEVAAEIERGKAAGAPVASPEAAASNPGASITLPGAATKK